MSFIEELSIAELRKRVDKLEAEANPKMAIYAEVADLQKRLTTLEGQFCQLIEHVTTLVDRCNSWFPKKPEKETQ